MVAITVKNKPSQPQKEGGVASNDQYINRTNKPKTISPAEAANK